MLLDWGSFQLMVFDVDGTLYDQKGLRRRMAGLLLRHAISTGGIETPLILRSYRKWREELAEQERERFEDILVGRLASHYRRSKADIESLVADWMERKPLPFLKEFRRPGVDDLFARLRKAGKTIGVLSDYPAQDKLAKLDLEADIVVSARDAEVELLKPHPRGIERVMQEAGVAPEATVMVGDRAERDGEMGRRAGVRTFILSSQRHSRLDVLPVLRPTPRSSRDDAVLNLKQTLAQLFRYGLTGGTAAVVDLGVFAVLCPAFLPVATAAVSSFLCAAVVNYALTSVYVFNTAFGARRFAKFLAFAIVGLAFNVSVTVLVASMTAAPPALAKTIGIGTAFLFNFWLNTVFVFGQWAPKAFAGDAER